MTNGASALAWTKVILVLVGIAFVAWLVYKIKTAGVAAYDAAKEIVSDTVENLNPSNYSNVFKTTTDEILSEQVGRSETLGGWLYSITHRDPVEEMISEKLEENPFPDYAGVP